MMVLKLCLTMLSFVLFHWSELICGSHGQLWYFLLCCNCKGGSLMWRTRSRRLCAWRGTERKMRMNGAAFPILTLRGKKSVGFAWRWTAKLCCPTAHMLCASDVTRTGMREISVSAHAFCVTPLSTIFSIAYFSCCASATFCVGSCCHYWSTSFLAGYIIQVYSLSW